MSNTIIPKEQLTPFERWDPASLDARSTGNFPGTGRQPHKIAANSGNENARQHQHEEGYAQGHAAGYAAGIQQARADAAQMQVLMQGLQESLNQLDGQLAQSLLDLSLEIARKMVGETLQVKPEVVLKIVSDAIGTLPHFNQNAHLILHPDDAELVRKLMGEQLTHTGWKLFTDAQITRGGCLVETAHSHVNATTEARWKNVSGSIGLDKPWQT